MNTEAKEPVPYAYLSPETKRALGIFLTEHGKSIEHDKIVATGTAIYEVVGHTRLEICTLSVLQVIINGSQDSMDQGSHPAGFSQFG